MEERIAAQTTRWHTHTPTAGEGAGEAGGAGKGAWCGADGRGHGQGHTGAAAPGRTRRTSAGRADATDAAPALLARRARHDASFERKVAEGRGVDTCGHCPVPTDSVCDLPDVRDMYDPLKQPKGEAWLRRVQERQQSTPWVTTCLGFVG